MHMAGVFDRMDGLLTGQFDDAPRQLKAITNLVLRAIRKGQFGEALSLLRQAQAQIEDRGAALADWRTEVAALWALYYAQGGPRPEVNAL
jgi:hypothetical protein